MRILFISPPNFRFREAGVQMFPYGPLFLAAVLKKDHDVAFYDAEGRSLEEQSANAHHHSNYEKLISSHSKYIHALENMDHPVWQEVESVIQDYNPDIIGISTMTSSYPSALVVAKKARKISNAILLMGGVHASLLPGEVIRTGLVDYVIRGEGEATLLEFIRHMESGTGFSDVNGLTYLKNDKVVHTPDRQFVPDLNCIPCPDMGALLFKERYPESCFANVLGGRGCPHHCHFCANHDIWKKYRMRSADAIFQEILSIYCNVGKTLYFLDDNFMAMGKTYLEICERMRTQTPEIMWRCQSRVDSLSEEKLQIAKESGCWDIKLGIESGSNRILKYMNKRLTVESAIKGCERILAKGIQVSANFMFGLPEETWEDMQATRELIVKLPANSVAISKFIPLPGTKFYRDVVALGIIKEHPPKYEYFDLYASRYHYPRHVSSAQLQAFYLEIFEIVQEKNKATRLGPPENRAKMHSIATVLDFAHRKIQ